MSGNDPWLCICGKTNTSPACSNCGRMDESASDALNKGGEEASKAGRASGLGIGWVTSQSSPVLVKGCWIYILLAIGIPIIVTIFYAIFR